MNLFSAKDPSDKVLQKLFLTLFLRGRSSRGLQTAGAPKSVGQKLGLTLLIYGLVGLVALIFSRQPVFALALQMHTMTFVFLGMFIASSAGEILFNKEEGDILMHRPISPQALLWAKISVLVRVSLWLAGALNLVTFFVGAAMKDGGWMFLPAHALATVLQALFCCGLVVVVYQLCLRWFGRERLDGLMTSAQVVVAIAAVASGQLLPYMTRWREKMVLSGEQWWVALLPPAWFAGMDDALGGQGSRSSWILAGFGVVATGVVLWLAFSKLAHDYQTGLQMLNEATAPRPQRRAQRRWVNRLVNAPPLRWWLRDSVARASFLLTAAYLVRDREVKLRVYPGLAPMLVMPLVFLFQEAQRKGTGGFGIVFSGAYLGLVPLMALNMLRYSAQWQASDLFRVAPMLGPAALCDGARRAVLVILTGPLVLSLLIIAYFMPGGTAQIPMLLPGIIALPLYALLPCLGGKGVPFSVPVEEGKAAGRGLNMIGVMISSMALVALALGAKHFGVFYWFLLLEAVAIGTLYAVLRARLRKEPWRPIE